MHLKKVRLTADGIWSGSSRFVPAPGAGAGAIIGSRAIALLSVAFALVRGPPLRRKR